MDDRYLRKKGDAEIVAIEILVHYVERELERFARVHSDIPCLEDQAGTTPSEVCVFDSNVNQIFNGPVCTYRDKIDEMSDAIPRRPWTATSESANNFGQNVSLSENTQYH